MRHDLNLGMIGNCAWCALIDRQATVVWACMPRFDGDPVFCGLLKAPGSIDGSFAIDVDRLAEARQHYERNTAILVTTLTDARGGVVEVTDFAPRFKQYGRTFRPATLIRRVRVRAGSPRIRVRLRPRFDYDAHAPAITCGSNHVRYVGSDQVLRLTTDASVTAVTDETWFVLEDEITLILGPDEPLSDAPGRIGRVFFEDTQDYWREWVRYLSLPFEWQDAVIRAAITLKLSTFEDTGAVIAAPTTSIPELADSGRNWDYRFCWLRDAYFVVNALARLGATRTMEDFIRFLIDLTVGREGESLRPVYRINGRNDLDEYTIERLAGYRGMAPVRVGNQAFEQVQNDIYGAAVRAAMPLFFDSRIPHGGDGALFEQLEWLGERAVAVYDEPDAGLWEFRGRARVHTFSAVMCWSACHGLARIAARIARPERARYWRDHAETIRSVIDREAWNDELGTISLAGLRRAGHPGARRHEPGGQGIRRQSGPARPGCAGAFALRRCRPRARRCGPGQSLRHRWRRRWHAGCAGHVAGRAPRTLASMMAVLRENDIHAWRKRFLEALLACRDRSS